MPTGDDDDNDDRAEVYLLLLLLDSNGRYSFVYDITSLLGIGGSVWVVFFFFFLKLPASPCDEDGGVGVDGGVCFFCCCTFLCLSRSIFLHSNL